MQRYLRKGLKTLFVGTVVTVLSFPIIAGPTLQKIEAYLNPTLTYFLDGEEVLQGVDAITYQDHTYISLAELSKVLGKEINYDNGVITMTTHETAIQEADTALIIERAVIKEVNLENGQIAILEEGKEDHFQNYLILNIDPDELIVQHEFFRIALRASSLVPGYIVSVKHDEPMTLSLPPQTHATAITILDGQPFPLEPETTTDSEVVPDASVHALPAAKMPTLD